MGDSQDAEALLPPPPAASVDGVSAQPSEAPAADTAKAAQPDTATAPSAVASPPPAASPIAQTAAAPADMPASLIPHSPPESLPVKPAAQPPAVRLPAVAPVKPISRDPALAKKTEIPFNGPANSPVNNPILPPPPNAAAEMSSASQTAPLLPAPRKSALSEFSGPDVAIILAHNQFYPSTIRVRSGAPTRLLFTTVNRKPGALILERMDVQRWIPGEPEAKPMTEAERARTEVDREVTAQKITEVLIEPKPGNYSFYDALSGATGEIIVE